MNWIEELDKHGHNFLIDELVWHIEEGRNPVSVCLISQASKSGFEFHFSNGEPSFLKVNPAALEASWTEAKRIVGFFSQLENLRFESS